MEDTKDEESGDFKPVASISTNESLYEIIDLQAFFSSSTFAAEDDNIIQSTPLPSSNENPDIFNPESWSTPKPLAVSYGDEEQLYSSYINGSMSFEELIKQLHTKPSLVNDRKVSKKFNMRRELSASKTRKRKAGDEFEDPLYDPDFAESDFEDEAPRRKRRTKSSAPRKRWDLKLELANYLGEAERHLNNGDFVKTEEICLNIINSAPQASAPHVVLADMFYRQGLRQQSQEHMLQAAERNPKDATLWMNLVDFAEDDGDLKRAIVYARNAMRCSRNDSQVRNRLIGLLMATGQEKEALRVRLTALLFAKGVDSRKVYNQMVKIAEEFATLGDIGGCIRTYELAFEKLPEICPAKDQLRVLDLFQEGDRPEESLKFFLMYWGASLICENGQVASPYRVPSNTTVMESIRRCELVEDMDLAVMIRFFILIMKYQLSAVIKDHLTSLLSSITPSDIRRNDGLFFDLAKSCKASGLISEGLTIAKKLAASPKTKSNAKVVCLLGDLQVEANLHEEALSTYRHVINRIDPRCTEARLALGNLLRRLGDEKASLEVLEPSLLMAPASTDVRGKSEHRASGDNEESGDEEDEDAEEEDDDDDDDAEDAEHTSSDSDGAGDLYSEVERLNMGDSHSSGDSDDDDDDDGTGNHKAVSLAPSVDTRQLSSARMLCNDPNAMRLAFERCKLLDSPSTIDQFLEESCRLLFHDVMQVYSCDRPGRELFLILHQIQ
uniref:TPR_REGION domain-containing protein n=1 Tax=Mesocestoides corti TaxID=53468 RepID=A0A5K3EVI0_MESCO